MKSLIKKTSAWLPIVISLTALAIVLVHIAMFGVKREADEGTVAHLFQLLMTLQVPIVVFFAIKWLPQRPKQAIMVLILQVIAALAACTPVYIFNF